MNFYISAVSEIIKLWADKGNSRLDGCEVRTSLFAINSCRFLSLLPYLLRGCIPRRHRRCTEAALCTRFLSTFLCQFIQFLQPAKFTCDVSPNLKC